MEPIEDYDLVPESFYTVGWWNKPNPFPEDLNEGKRRRKWLKDQEEVEHGHSVVANEGFSGGDADHRRAFTDMLNSRRDG